MKRLAMLVLFTAVLSSCASIFDGDSQEIEIATTPLGAQCQLIRDGETIGQLTTPNTITVETLKHDIFIECRKKGYQKATFVNKSGLNTWVYGNVLTFGLGYGVDAYSGAQNLYTEKINIPLTRSRSTPGGVAASGIGTGSSAITQGFPPLGTQSSVASQPSRAQTPARSYPATTSSTAAMMPGREPVPPPAAVKPGPVAGAASSGAASSGGASYGVLFASYDSADQARQGWNQIWNRYWSVLSGVTPYIEYGTVGNSANRFNLYGKTATRAHASRLCQGIRQRGAACPVVYF